MISHRNKNGRVVDPRWHRFRAEARRDAFSPTEFSDIDRERYNLDDDDEFSANLDGELTERRFGGQQTRERVQGAPKAVPPEEADDDPIRF